MPVDVGISISYFIRQAIRCLADYLEVPNDCVHCFVIGLELLK
ncbi:MAG TPA: hypothetical protein VNU72_05975 [Puia sp.]|nr:hypothetical protein [Puia sp.]